MTDSEKEEPQETPFTANIGYVISTNGFQSGSYKAAKYTNVRIATWEEFQELFEEKWLKNYFSKYIENILTH